MDRSERALRMGTAPVLPLIFKMSLPAIFSMLVSALYNIVDSMFISWYAEEGLTAVSLAFPVQMLITAVGVGTSVGINSLISRRLGERRQEEADSAASHGIVLAVLSAIPFIIFGLFFTRPFFNAFTGDAMVVEYGVQYLSIVMICSFAILMEMAAEKTLQATGNMIAPMVSKLIGSVANLILDPILIFGFMGIPAMGVTGAAIATVAGQFLAMGFLVFTLFTKSHAVSIHLKGFRFNKDTVKNIYVVGLPSIVMQAIGSVASIGMNGILSGFSDMAVSVMGVYGKLQSFVFMPLFGLNQGLMPILGYNYGARNKKRFTDALKYAVIIAVCIMTFGTLLFFLFPRTLLSIFQASEEMMELGTIAFRAISVCFIPAAIGISTGTVFQAVGLGIKSLIVSLLRQLVCLLPLAYFLSKISLTAVWYAYPLAEVVSLAVTLLFLKQVYDSKIKPMGE